METIAKHRYARTSAQKARLVADLIRGKKVSVALEILTFTNKKAAALVKKVLESAIANAEHNDGADVDDLKVAKIFVDEGPSMKRVMPRAKGRADRILNRTSHIPVVVSDRSSSRTNNGSKSTSTWYSPRYCKTLELYLVCEYTRLR